VLALGRPTGKVGRYAMSVDTKLLPSNRQTRVVVAVDVNGSRACSLAVRLHVDNVPPRILTAGARRAVAGAEVAFRLSEGATVTVTVGSHVRRLRVVARRTMHLTVAARGSVVRITARDRAGNTTARRLTLR
jgi:hypothetical protein